jgi:RimJ/RimL family protein N-acetyltransferase
MTSVDTKLGFVPVKLTKKDARLIIKWRNDPVTRANSINGDKKVMCQYWPSMSTNIGHIAYFGTLDGEKVGFIGFKEFLGEDGLEVSIHVAPEHRGKGVALKMLQGIEEILEGMDVFDIHAFVKQDNEASQKLFEKAGYVPAGSCKQETDTGDVILYWYTRDLG